MCPDRLKVVSKIPPPLAATARLNDATFRALIEQSNDAIVMFDADWNVMYISPGTERVLGFKPAEIRSSETFSDIHPDDIPRVKAWFDECLANPGKPITTIARIRHKDGSWRTLEGVLTNLLHDPQVRGIVANYRDITKRIEAERALRESEEKFKRTFQSNPNSMSINTLDEGIFLDVNDAFLRTTGFRREDVIGHHSTETSWVDKEDRSRMLRLLHEQGRVEGMETAFRTKSGKVLFSSLSAVMVEIGGLQCVLTTSQDITERRRAAEKLRLSEEKYRSLVELAPYGIFRATRDGRLLMVNSALVKMLGYDSAEEVLRLDLETQIYADPTERERILIRVQGARGPRVETTWKRKDGSTISVRLAGRLIYGNKNEVLQTEVFVENVTEQRALERQLLTAQKMEAIGQLAGGMAHDFNNLLAVINSRAALVMDDACQRAQVVAQAEEIVRATHRAATLTRQLLALSRKQVLEPVVLNLNALLTELGDMLPHLVGKNIETRIITAPELGRVKVDRGQFEQVVMNLAINARDAMPNGGCLVIETTNIKLDVNQAARYPLMEAGGYVVLSVTDNGVGMDQETQEHIFEPFFTTKERGKGTGLGLAMVYGIVQQSDGHISVATAPGTGTSFKIYLPEVTELEETAETEQLLPLPGGTETIMFVEDEEGLREVCANFLRSKGYDVLTAEDGIEALSICRTLDRPVHLLVTDLIMPRMGGAELAKRALALNPGLRTIYVSAYNSQALLHGAPGAGQALLQKPFSMAELAKQVRASLNSTTEPERELAS
jgi:two-component system, cell cycle sensor histidine kinase and response regulator CckA